MLRFLFLFLLWLCIVGTMRTQAQQKSTTLIQSTFEDERIDISVDKSVYFPGDTVHLAIQRNDSATKAVVVPILPIGGTHLKSIGRGRYIVAVPQGVTPGLYPISLTVTDSEGRRFRYVTDCVVAVEEFQDVEKLGRYAGIIPVGGSDNIRAAMTLDREQVRSLEVQFQRDSIRLGMGPQFVRITTTILSRDEVVHPSYERRVLTYRSHGSRQQDRAMFIQYRTAYGAYAAISAAELGQVRIPFDSLPDWAIIKVNVEPDYLIKIGAYDRSNSVTRYFRVRGPSIEVGFSLGIPKVLYDTRAEDTIEYGNTSAMLRLYFVNMETGNRFPISVGVGTFGVNSPIDVGVGRGGFAMSMFLDLVELTRTFDIELIEKINVGLELTPFLSIKKKSRFLFNAQVSLSI